MSFIINILTVICTVLIAIYSYRADVTDLDNVKRRNKVVTVFIAVVIGVLAVFGIIIGHFESKESKRINNELISSNQDLQNLNLGLNLKNDSLFSQNNMLIELARSQNIVSKNIQLGQKSLNEDYQKAVRRNQGLNSKLEELRGLLLRKDIRIDQLEKKVLGRFLSNEEENRLIEALKEYNGSIIFISSPMDDPEAEAFANQFAKVFKMANWNVDEQAIGSILWKSGGGITFRPESKESIDISFANEILNIFKENGINAEMKEEQNKIRKFWISIGARMDGIRKNNN